MEVVMEMCVYICVYVASNMYIVQEVRLSA
jgi:hypothetical protein